MGLTFESVQWRDHSRCVCSGRNDAATSGLPRTCDEHGKAAAADYIARHGLCFQGNSICHPSDLRLCSFSSYSAALHDAQHPELLWPKEAHSTLPGIVCTFLFSFQKQNTFSLVQILGEHESSVKKMLDEFGVYLKPSIFGKDVKPFLKDACSQIFGSATGLVDMMVAHVPSSKAGNATKVHLPFSNVLCPSPFFPHRLLVDCFLVCIAVIHHFICVTNLGGLMSQGGDFANSTATCVWL